MVDAPHTQSNSTSRRTILLGGVGCVTGIVASLQSARYASAAKMAPTAVAYQDSPKGTQECSNCAFFEAPNACKVVDGNISPSAWCKLWAKKAG